MEVGKRVVGEGGGKGGQEGRGGLGHGGGREGGGDKG